MHSVVTSEKTPFRSLEAARDNVPETLAVPCHIAVYSIKGGIRSLIGQQGKNAFAFRTALVPAHCIADG